MTERKPRLTAAEWMGVRSQYEHTDKPVAGIAREAGIGRSTLSARARRENWRRRRPSRVRTAAEGLTDIPAQVERTIERELGAIDAILAQLASGGEPTPASERTARTLASLTRTLKEVQRLRAAEAEERKKSAAAADDDMPEDDDLPRDIDEFRRELARRIDAFVASRTDAELPETGE